jgi:cell division control protein 6
LSSDIDNIFTKAASGRSLVKNRRALTIDYVPEKLPFRDEEIKALAQVLSTIFKGARPSNLLLFGKPGTGKTAAARSVVDRLAKNASELNTDVIVLWNQQGAGKASSLYRPVDGRSNRQGLEFYTKKKT